MIRSTGRSSVLGRNTSRGAAHTVPTGRVAFLNTFQAINCLATIIWSLRDKHICVLMLTRMRGFILSGWPHPKRDQFPPANFVRFLAGLGRGEPEGRDCGLGVALLLGLFIAIN